VNKIAWNDIRCICIPFFAGARQVIEHSDACCDDVDFSVMSAFAHDSGVGKRQRLRRTC